MVTPANAEISLGATPATECAAVTNHWFPIIDALHSAELRIFRFTCHGTCAIAIGAPPTIRGVVAWAGAPNPTTRASDPPKVISALIFRPTVQLCRYAKSMDSSRWSIGSQNSFLSIYSKNSVLSIGSIGSAGSLLSIGSFASVGSILSAVSCASVMAWKSVMKW